MKTAAPRDRRTRSLDRDPRMPSPSASPWPSRRPVSRGPPLGESAYPRHAPRGRSGSGGSRSHGMGPRQSGSFVTMTPAPSCRRTVPSTTPRRPEQAAVPPVAVEAVAGDAEPGAAGVQVVEGVALAMVRPATGHRARLQLEEEPAPSALTARPSPLPHPPAPRIEHLQAVSGITMQPGDTSQRAGDLTSRSTFAGRRCSPRRRPSLEVAFLDDRPARFCWQCTRRVGVRSLVVPGRSAPRVAGPRPRPIPHEPTTSAGDAWTRRPSKRTSSHQVP